MKRISDKLLNDHLDGLAMEWERIQAFQRKNGLKSITHEGLGSNLWWLNQAGYLGEKFGVALIRDLQDARNCLAEIDFVLIQLQDKPKRHNIENAIKILTRIKEKQKALRSDENQL